MQMAHLRKRTEPTNSEGKMLTNRTTVLVRFQIHVKGGSTLLYTSGYVRDETSVQEVY